MNTNRGFTLIELLLALSIAALIYMGILFLFQTSLNSKNVIEEQAESMAKIGRAMRVIEQDIIQLSPYRSVRDPFGDFRPAIEMTFEGLYLTRNGWAISQFSSYQRSSQQRVHYRLAEPGSELCPWAEDDEVNDAGGCLIRSFQLQLDDDGSLAWQHQPLLRPVKTMNWQFLIDDPESGSMDFRNELPQEDPRDGVTRSRLIGVQVEVQTGQGQSLKRLFSTPTLPVYVEPEQGS